MHKVRVAVAVLSLFFACGAGANASGLINVSISPDAGRSGSTVTVAAVGFRDTAQNPRVTTTYTARVFDAHDNTGTRYIDGGEKIFTITPSANGAANAFGGTVLERTETVSRPISISITTEAFALRGGTSTIRFTARSEAATVTAQRVFHLAGAPDPDDNIRPHKILPSPPP